MMTTLNLQDIANCGVAKRAIEVALVQGNSIRLVGTETAKELAEWAESWGLKAQAIAQCPCGGFGHPSKPCNCTPNRIRQFKLKEWGQNYDMEVKVTDNPDLVYKMIIGEHKEEDQKLMLARVKEAQKLVGKIKGALSLIALEELASGVKRLGLTYRQGKTLLSISKSIASLNGNNSIDLKAVLEALQYVPKGGNSL